ncbi:Up-regulated during septation-domain-containing protein [Apodospora peruviana]|uniref:Up-regulated during septation-domain-containing protein n=1 Tax=Apodospora peruviana TaxID=516989 RepID=A0AAE0MC72_9PEZI|nr:Up-regulated during septation-domain-containing protein [Apodospora peruviana]
MHQPERKYQLFPKDKQSAVSPGKSLDPEQAFALAMGQNGEKGDKTTSGTGLRIRIKEHNLIRRRKVSVPELGPMTTVQEVAMDSPTIPGRPPLHERSISAPGPSWKQHHLVECMRLPRDQVPDERAEHNATAQHTVQVSRSQAELRQPLSPKSLTPLVIPPVNSAAPRLTRQISLSRLRSGSTPIEPTLRSAKTDDSPKARTPFTPLSAALSTPRSAATSTLTTSTLPTPISAPVESRSSPKPWERIANYAVVGTPKETGPDVFSTPKAEPTEPRSASTIGHRRNQSESGSIMERGRPRKRNDSNGGSILKRAESKRSKSAERRAFEQLPKGWKATDAMNMLSQGEVAALQKQALQQAARFEVLRKEDVDNLSRELRQLDERTDYLRRTYTSLRAGRRNLHTRICQYLRSPRTAKFSHDSMLKQEEALAELDASIDDWVMKLEQAENRRTRVRQKLLEHVAAAATLAVSPTGGVVGVSESLQLAMGVRPLNSSNGAGNISTPPRSPVKAIFSSHTHSSSPSPQRVVAQVPSTILEQPLFEEAASIGAPSAKEDAATTLRRAETIRIYADNDVYALLADVENAITKMSAGDFSSNTESLSDAERRHVHRTRSHELLNASGKRLSPTSSSDENLSPNSTGPSSAACTPPPVPEKSSGEIFLTSAVFRPERSNTGF